MRLAALSTLLLALSTGAAIAATATAAAAPAPGPIQFWATPGPGDSPRGKIVITGAIGDYGKTTNTDKNGKVNTDGDYVRLALSDGSFVVDTSAIKTRFAHLRPKIDAQTCTVVFQVSAVPVVISKGTGTYAGISGRGKLNFLFAGIASRYATGAKKDQCNLSNGAPERAGYSSVTGTAQVKYG